MFYALAENIRSLFNVGTIFRTADGAGVQKLFLTGITGTPPHREIRKVALGAEETIAWQYEKDCLAVARKLKSEGVQLVVLETTEKSVIYDQADIKFPCCLVIGNEFNGVSSEMLEEADLLIEIPMRGKKISLNVGVAFGVAAYEISKQLETE